MSTSTSTPASTPQREQEWTTITRGAPRRTQRNREPKGNVIQYHERKSKRRQRQHTTIPAVSDQVISLRNTLVESPWWIKTSQLITESLGGEQPKFIQCLGLGSFENSQNSIHQLAFVLLLKQLLNVTVCSISDPNMTSNDKQLVCDIGLHVSDSRHIDDIVIEGSDDTECGVLFMPHCGKHLNMAILECWAQRTRSDNIVYIGNVLSGYDVSENQSQLLSCLFEREFIKEVRCPDSKSSTSEFAFNDLAVIYLSYL